MGIFTPAASEKLVGSSSGKGKAKKPFFPPVIQPKIAIGPVDDTYEREADSVADAVMSTHDENDSRVVQRKCNACELEEKKLSRQEMNNDSIVANVSTENYIGSLNSKGRSLTPGEKDFFEPRFGYDFSNVQLHTNSEANDSAQSINALAYTHGNNIVFGANQYQPDTETGKSLMAHELTHVIQQDNGIRRISRATYKIGKASVNVDYDAVTGYIGGQFEQGLLNIFTTYTGKDAAVLQPQITALTDEQKRMLMYAIDLMIDNPLPGLNKDAVVNRLTPYVPSMTSRPWGVSGANHVFEDEVLRVSGWLENALSAGLSAPSSSDQRLLDFAYTHDNSSATSGGSSCPSPRSASDQLDETKLRSELPVRFKASLTAKANAAAKGVGSVQNISDITPIATIIQKEALSFFNPYIGRGRENNYLPTWDYSAHLTSSTSPGAIPKDLSLAYLQNRAKGIGDDSGLFTEVNFDQRCSADVAVFDDIIDILSKDAAVQSQLNTILSLQSFTHRDDKSADTVINLQSAPGVNECMARWRTIKTLCHELLHPYIHPDFEALSKGRRIIKEGFTEVLSFQLYSSVRAKAMGDPGYRAQFETGLTAGVCNKVDVPAFEVQYGDDGHYAAGIRSIVGDDRFRAAYFLGKTTLAGLQPKLQSGSLNNPAERAADAMAEKIIQPNPIQQDAGQAIQREHAGPAIQRQHAGPAIQWQHASPVIQRQPHVPSPADAQAVANAKRKLAIIEPRIKAMAGRQVEVDSERLRVLADREGMDRRVGEADLNAVATGDPLIRQHTEDQTIAALNNKPVSIAVNATDVTINVKFHVKFEDPAMQSKFSVVQDTMNKGLDMIWNQQLQGDAFGGRKFKVVPSYTLIDSTTARDNNFWLIVIRKVDPGPINYPGCKVTNPGSGVPTSVTEPSCDGGVMFIPPSHISKPGVLGHELLHLFGLVDRYFSETHFPKGGGKPVNVNIPLRDTKGRADPLAAQDGTILKEDLGFLFDRFGVYDQEIRRSTFGLGDLQHEAARLEEIIRLGYDPNSLLPIRKDFKDRMTKDAENL